MVEGKHVRPSICGTRAVVPAKGVQDCERGPDVEAKQQQRRSDVDQQRRGGAHTAALAVECEHGLQFVDGAQLWAAHRAHPPPNKF